MKKIFFIALLLISNFVYAQTSPLGAVRNDNAATTVQGTNLANSKLSTDLTGGLFLAYNGANAPLKTEDVAHVTGDKGVQCLGVANETANPLAADGDYVPQAAHITGTSFVNIWQPAIPAANRGASIVKGEDVAHVSGDVGVASLGVNNRNSSTFNSTNGDYTPIGVGDTGNVMSSLVYDSNFTATAGPISREDNTFGANDALVMMGAQSLSTLTQSVGTSGDAAPPALDLLNRTIVSTAPPGSITNGCSPSAVTTNTTQTLIAAVASNFHYVTGFECQNTAAVGSLVILEDGTGTDLGRCYLPPVASGGSCSITVGNVPIRATASNSLIQINVSTTGTSTTCCARGYTAVL